MRSLSPDEAELWARVAATIKPLSREKLPVEDARQSTPASAPSTRLEIPPVAARHPKTRPLPISEQTLDGSWDKKLRSGSVDPGRIIDLHGMDMDRAWNAIDRGLDEAIVRGERLILLITGHHRPGEPPVQRGKIRAAVHDWLAASRHAREIAAVRGAHRRHGGGGSLYLVLRRRPLRR